MRTVPARQRERLLKTIDFSIILTGWWRGRERWYRVRGGTFGTFRLSLQSLYEAFAAGLEDLRSVGAALLALHLLDLRGGEGGLELVPCEIHYGHALATCWRVPTGG